MENSSLAFINKLIRGNVWFVTLTVREHVLWLLRSFESAQEHVGSLKEQLARKTEQLAIALQESSTLTRRLEASEQQKNDLMAELKKEKLGHVEQCAQSQQTVRRLNSEVVEMAEWTEKLERIFREVRDSLALLEKSS
jgi:hypothetical protein